jgi:hypothetical protein
MISANSGFCTCKCTPDNPGTLIANEDTCPEPTKNRCASYPGAGGADTYCFHFLVNKLSNCMGTYFHGWDKTNVRPKDPLMIAAALGTTTSSFTVASVQYRLWNQTSTEPCDNTLPHRADVWVDNLSFPVPNPVVGETIDIPTATGTQSLRVVDLALTSPLQITQGENVLVAVEIRPDAAKIKALCLAVCDGTGATTFGTMGSTSPYKWGDWTTYGKEAAVFAHGFGE